MKRVLTLRFRKWAGPVGDEKFFFTKLLELASDGGAVGLVDTYNLDRVSREGSTNDKALSAGVSR